MTKPNNNKVKSVSDHKNKHTKYAKLQMNGQDKHMPHIRFNPYHN